MVAVKAAGVDAFLARPDKAVVCVLLYGPDSGLVTERAGGLIKTVLPELDDTFGLVRLDGDDIASDPGRLLDEANSVSMFGGRRAIWIKAGSRAFQGAVEALLTGPAPDAFVVIEAGDLRKGAPLRALCEKNPRAAALPCFADNEAAIGRLIDADFSVAGITLDRDARTALVASLGSDRMATRQEIDKLLLYAHGAERVSLADIDAITADTSALALDEAVDAVFAGNGAALDRGLARLAASGTAPPQVLAAVLRHLLQLHRLRAEMARGTGAAQVLERGWPGLHFRRKALVEAALSRWPLPRLDDAVRRCGEGVLESRRAGAFGDVLAARILASLTQEARRL
jgi:DNA polymerase-3 subunit delta